MINEKEQARWFNSFLSKDFTTADYYGMKASYNTKIPCIFPMNNLDDLEIYKEVITAVVSELNKSITFLNRIKMYGFSYANIMAKY